MGNSVGKLFFEDVKTKELLQALQEKITSLEEQLAQQDEEFYKEKASLEATIHSQSLSNSKMRINAYKHEHLYKQTKQHAENVEKENTTLKSLLEEARAQFADKNDLKESERELLEQKLNEALNALEENKAIIQSLKLKDQEFKDQVEQTQRQMDKTHANTLADMLNRYERLAETLDAKHKRELDAERSAHEQAQRALVDKYDKIVRELSEKLEAAKSLHHQVAEMTPTNNSSGSNSQTIRPETSSSSAAELMTPTPKTILNRRLSRSSSRSSSSSSMHSLKMTLSPPKPRRERQSLMLPQTTKRSYEDYEDRIHDFDEYNLVDTPAAAAQPPPKSKRRTLAAFLPDSTSPVMQPIVKHFKTFSSASSLTSQQTAYEGEKNVSCPLCSKWLKHIPSLRGHLKGPHKMQPDEIKAIIDQLKEQMKSANNSVISCVND